MESVIFHKTGEDNSWLIRHIKLERTAIHIAQHIFVKLLRNIRIRIQLKITARRMKVVRGKRILIEEAVNLY